MNKSTEVMKIVNDLIKVGSMQAGMRELAKGVPHISWRALQHLRYPG
jgi:hypothetical protein